MENSYSPIFKDTSHLPSPSPLTTAVTTTPTRGVSFNVIPQASTSLSYRPPLLPSHSSAHSSSSFPTTSQSSLPFVPPIPPRPTTLFGARVLASTIGGGNGALVGSRPLLSGTNNPHPVLHYNPFPATSGLFKHSQQQQLHQVSTPQTLLSLSQLNPSSLPFNPLVSMCTTQPLQGYNANVMYNTPGAIPPPSYMPLVNLVTTPTPAMATPPSYMYNMQMMSPERNTEAGMTGSVEMKALQSVPPWFIFSSNRSDKV